MYKTIKHIVVTEDAPALTEADLMSMKEAADYLTTTIGNVRNMLDRGELTAVIDGQEVTPRGTPRRSVLRSEVEALRQQRADSTA